MGSKELAKQITANHNCGIMFAPTSDSMNYFPIISEHEAPKKHTMIKTERVYLLQANYHFVFYVPYGNHRELRMMCPRGDWNRKLDEFTESVTALKLGLERLVIVLQTKIIVSTMKMTGPSVKDWPLERELQFYDMAHLRPSLVSLGSGSQGEVLACPSEDGSWNRIQLYQLDKKEVLSSFRAHRSMLVCAALNSTSTLVATASEKGRVVRIYSYKGCMLQEVRRSWRQHPFISALYFSPHSSYLLSASDAIHIHQLDLDKLYDTADFSISRGIVSNFNKRLFLDRAFATVEVPGGTKGVKIHGFHNGFPETLAVVVSDEASVVRLFKVDEVNGGVCKQILEFDTAKAETSEYCF